MHYYVGRDDGSAYTVPDDCAGHAQGYTRAALVTRACGSVHMEGAMARLAPGGFVESRVHAYEKGIYLLEGTLELLRGADHLCLTADDYALIPYATAHALRNRGTAGARWFEVLTPQPKPAAALRDSFFTGGTAWPADPPAVAGEAAAPLSGRFRPAQPIPAQDGALARGLTVYRFMERRFGAQCFFMMRGEMAPGAFRARHDHPVEEFYLGLDGAVDMEIEDRVFRLGAGDFAWTGVGTSHAFRQVGDVPFRWLETQTPQFPPAHGTRNYVEWEKLRAGR